MSSLWTPSGERPVPRPGQPAPSNEPQAPGAAPPPKAPAGAASGPEDEVTREEMAAELERLREQLSETPPEAVVANHCYGLFELAALHLSLDPPGLDGARLAIDAMACLVDGLSGRLGEHGPPLIEGLAQIRLAFVQIQGSGTAPVGTT